MLLATAECSLVLSHLNLSFFQRKSLRPDLSRLIHPSRSPPSTQDVSFFSHEIAASARCDSIMNEINCERSFFSWQRWFRLIRVEARRESAKFITFECQQTATKPCSPHKKTESTSSGEEVLAWRRSLSGKIEKFLEDFCWLAPATVPFLARHRHLIMSPAPASILADCQHRPVTRRREREMRRKKLLTQNINKSPRNPNCLGSDSCVNKTQPKPERRGKKSSQRLNKH